MLFQQKILEVTSDSTLVIACHCMSLHVIACHCMSLHQSVTCKMDLNDTVLDMTTNFANSFHERELLSNYCVSGGLSTTPASVRGISLQQAKTLQGKQSVFLPSRTFLIFLWPHLTLAGGRHFSQGR
jgi:hypothetical protein